MRGKKCLTDEVEVVQRITPAYAGKRIESKENAARCWDHPRVCGEKANGDGAHLAVVGSPPRMRGKVIARTLAWP